MPASANNIGHQYLIGRHFVMEEELVFANSEAKAGPLVQICVNCILYDPHEHVTDGSREPIQSIEYTLYFCRSTNKIRVTTLVYHKIQGQLFE